MKLLTKEEITTDLTRLLGKVTAGWTPLPSDEATALDSLLGVQHVQQETSSRVVALIRFDKGSVSALACTPSRPLHDRDLQFIRKLVGVFNHDVQSIGDLHRAREAWSSLSRTRFQRTIARVSPFSTLSFVTSLSTFEAATRQTYEGRLFTGGVVFTKMLPPFAAEAGDRFIPFTESLSFQDALLAEKWVKPLLSSGDLALVAVGRSSRIAGVVDCTQPVGSSSNNAPHNRLRGLYEFLSPGRLVVTSSASGDIYTSLPNGLTFTMSQGRWRYEDLDGFRDLLVQHLPFDVAVAIMRLALDASFERSGALYVFLKDGSSVEDVVPDHSNINRVAAPLRNTASGLMISSASARRVIAAAARADGAAILDRDGKVLDVACMVAEPNKSARDQHGLTELKRFSGARTTAAWNASFSGLSIKISEDGPIEVFAAGNLLSRIG